MTNELLELLALLARHDDQLAAQILAHVKHETPASE